MPNVGVIQINLNFDDKSKLKLEAIANHMGALADELDDIDAMNAEDVAECLKNVLRGDDSGKLRMPLWLQWQCKRRTTPR